MSILLELTPEIERELQAQADAQGVSLADYARGILEKQVQPPPAGRRQTVQDFLDACARVRGFTDDLDITRRPSSSRPVDLS